MGLSNTSSRSVLFHYHAKLLLAASKTNTSFSRLSASSSYVSLDLQQDNVHFASTFHSVLLSRKLKRGKSNQHIFIVFKPYYMWAYFCLLLELFGFTNIQYIVIVPCQKWKDNKSVLAKVFILHFDISKSRPIVTEQLPKQRRGYEKN